MAWPFGRADDPSEGPFCPQALVELSLTLGAYRTISGRDRRFGHGGVASATSLSGEITP
jgi:hypothetical protein